MITSEWECMKVSVLITAFNEEAYIGECLESIAAQDHPEGDLEVVVVNDGSTDNTEGVVQRYARRNTIYVAQENQGIASARNKAMQLATGDVLAVVGADDYITPNCISRCAQELKAYPEVGLVYSQHVRVKEDGTVIKLQEKPQWDREAFRQADHNFVGLIQVVRAELARNIEFDPSFFYSEDRDWLMRLADSGVDFKHIPEPLYFWRKNPGSIGQRMPTEERLHYSRLSRARGLSCQEE